MRNRKRRSPFRSTFRREMVRCTAAPHMSPKSYSPSPLQGQRELPWRHHGVFRVRISCCRKFRSIECFSRALLRSEHQLSSCKRNGNAVDDFRPNSVGCIFVADAACFGHSAPCPTFPSTVSFSSMMTRLFHWSVTQLCPFHVPMTWWLAHCHTDEMASQGGIREKLLRVSMPFEKGRNSISGLDGHGRLAGAASAVRLCRRSSFH